MRTFLKWLSYITIGVVGGIVCLILWATLVQSIISMSITPISILLCTMYFRDA